jgi:AraC-like DNA-binding protein
MTIDTVTEIKALHFPDLKAKGFKIHRISNPVNPSIQHGRRDFYKIGLVTGNMEVNYGDKTSVLHGTSLFFINPNISHSVVRHSKNISGYACLFTEAFISGRERTKILKNSPLFQFNESPAVHLNKEQALFMTGIFQKMQSVHSDNYGYKNELLRNCIELILHEAVRIQPPQNGLQHTNAAARIANLFIDLLERQFPIESTDAPLALRSPNDFAEALSVHVNYLNRSVKEVTGKPTSVHIGNRIAAEAKALLLYTDWSVADIAYGLGFEYPTYFNNYFKRVTGTNPKSLRKEKV